MTIRVIVNGAKGKMGQTTVEALSNQPDLTLVATTDHGDDLGAAITKNKADVVVDFTIPQVVFNNTQTIIANKARPVIGTTGLTQEQIQELTAQCQKAKLGGMIVPNFSLGAVLMMRYAQDAAKYFPDVEIIEMHHQQKIDAPSGTAIKTANMISANRKASPTKLADTKPRGFNYDDITIHSVRLPGFFAHQMVIFGEAGETLTLKHDAIDRKAMMPGVLLACRKVMKLDHMVYGLENILD